MTQLTYTIAHIKVGAENYWGEVETKYENLINTSIFYTLSANKEYIFKIHYPDLDIANVIKRNDNHPLSKLANELGAIVYGGFEDEKDFYLMMPTIKYLSYKGNCCDHQSIYEETNLKTGDYHKYAGSCRDYDYDLCVFGDRNYNTKDRCDIWHNFYVIERINTTNEEAERLHGSCINDYFSTVSGNIFQEYARTGIIENDLYKRFFK